MDENKVDNILLNEYKIASEYHQAALCTFGRGDKYERKFRYNLSKVKRKIRLTHPNFKFEPTKEVINIDYSLFDQDIEELLRKDYESLTAEEFNFVGHFCSGGMFTLFGITQIELEYLKDLYLFIHESDYITIKRMRIINDIISD